jgi:hypothetical protein
VFKKYKASRIDDVDKSALEALVEWADSLRLGDAKQKMIASCCALPVSVVVSDDTRKPLGFLMSPTSNEFIGPDGNPIAFEQLINPRVDSERSGRPWFEPAQKVARLGDLLHVVGALHHRGGIVGDLQDRNILTGPPGLIRTPGSLPSILLVDCDSFVVEGRSVLPRMDPDPWRTKGAEGQFSQDSDMYKFGILALRADGEDHSFHEMQPGSRLFSEIILTEDSDVVRRWLDSGRADPPATSVAYLSDTWRALDRNGTLYSQRDGIRREIGAIAVPHMAARRPVSDTPPTPSAPSAPPAPVVSPPRTARMEPMNRPPRNVRTTPARQRIFARQILALFGGVVALLLLLALLMREPETTDNSERRFGAIESVALGSIRMDEGWVSHA